MRRKPCPSGAAFDARALDGSGETELMPEAQGIGRGGVCVRALGGRARRNLRPRPVGSGVPCFGLEIEEVDSRGPCAGDPRGLALPFVIFYYSDLGTPFYATQH